MGNSREELAQWSRRELLTIIEELQAECAEHVKAKAPRYAEFGRLQARIEELEERIKVLTGPMICEARIAELEAEVIYLRTRDKEQGAYIEQVLDELEEENDRLRDRLIHELTCAGGLTYEQALKVAEVDDE